MKHLKEEFDKLTFKDAMAYSMAYLSLIVGFVMLFIGMYTEPRGQIHESVLTAFGIILVFVGAILGISLHYNNELARIRTAIPDLVSQLMSEAKKDEKTNVNITLEKGEGGGSNG